MTQATRCLVLALITWKNYDLKALDIDHFPKIGRDINESVSAKLLITPETEKLVVRYIGSTSDYKYAASWDETVPLYKLGIFEHLYPSASSSGVIPPAADLINQAGMIAAAYNPKRSSESK